MISAELDPKNTIVASPEGDPVTSVPISAAHGSRDLSAAAPDSLGRAPMAQLARFFLPPSKVEQQPALEAHQVIPPFTHDPAHDPALTAPTPRCYRRR